MVIGSKKMAHYKFDICSRQVYLAKTKEKPK